MVKNSKPVINLFADFMDSYLVKVIHLISSILLIIFIVCALTAVPAIEKNSSEVCQLDNMNPHTLLLLS